jgi:hypothetical protein
LDTKQQEQSKPNTKGWRFPRSKQMSKVEEVQTIEWQKLKGQRDKQWSAKYYTES